MAPQPFLPANPRWLPTFTVVLLAIVCMLVVMLSLSRPDYRRLALVSGELAAGFGNEDSLAGDPVPLGASVIVPDFHPDGEPSPIDKPWQGSGQLPPLELPVAAVPPAAAATAAPRPPGPTPESRALAHTAVDALIAGARKQAGALAARFGGGISRGEVEIETRGRTVVLRLLEKGSFAPGSTILLPAMRKQLQDVASVVAAQPGPLVLRGHHAGIGLAADLDRTADPARDDQREVAPPCIARSECAKVLAQRGEHAGHARARLRVASGAAGIDRRAIRRCVHRERKTAEQRRRSCSQPSQCQSAAHFASGSATPMTAATEQL